MVGLVPGIMPKSEVVVSRPDVWRVAGVGLEGDLVGAAGRRRWSGWCRASCRSRVRGVAGGGVERSAGVGLEGDLVAAGGGGDARAGAGHHAEVEVRCRRRPVDPEVARVGLEGDLVAAVGEAAMLGLVPAIMPSEVVGLAADVWTQRSPCWLGRRSGYRRGWRRYSGWCLAIMPRLR